MARVEATLPMAYFFLQIRCSCGEWHKKVVMPIFNRSEVKKGNKTPKIQSKSASAFSSTVWGYMMFSSIEALNNCGFLLSLNHQNDSKDLRITDKKAPMYPGILSTAYIRLLGSAEKNKKETRAHLTIARAIIELQVIIAPTRSNYWHKMQKVAINQPF